MSKGAELCKVMNFRDQAKFVNNVRARTYQKVKKIELGTDRLV